MWLSVLLLGASGNRGCRRGRSPCPDALLCCLFCWNFTGSDFEGWMEKRGHFCLIWNIYALRPDSCTYKHPYISPWKHTRSYSFYALHRLAHRSVRTDRTFRRCRSRPGYRPTLLDGQPLLRPLSHCPAPAAPSSTPDFCCFPGGRSRVIQHRSLHKPGKENPVVILS